MGQPLIIWGHDEDFYWPRSWEIMYLEVTVRPPTLSRLNCLNFDLKISPYILRLVPENKGCSKSRWVHFNVKLYFFFVIIPFSHFGCLVLPTHPILNEHPTPLRKESQTHWKLIFYALPGFQRVLWTCNVMEITIDWPPGTIHFIAPASKKYFMRYTIVLDK